MTTSRDILIRTGQALYGERWQTPLAHDLGASDRTVRRWVAGHSPVPPGVVADLRCLIAGRADDLREILDEIPKPTD
jgi:hypothetical protein